MHPLGSSHLRGDQPGTGNRICDPSLIGLRCDHYHLSDGIPTCWHCETSSQAVKSHLMRQIHPSTRPEKEQTSFNLAMILESEREVQREFNAIYNHLIELKYALDQKKDTRSNRILGMIRKMEELIYETEVE
ncbi:MAG: hypothetical protein CMK53_05290 [Proteobacteria bacterium]|nr:hypothetical protein [Pseudomonadota bacterium]